MIRTSRLSFLLVLGLAFIAGDFRAYAFPDSPFPSSVPGLDVPNAHVLVVGQDGAHGTVIRGSSPMNNDADERVHELVQYGVTDVLIFKNQIFDEVDQEIAAFKTAGIAPERIESIPFPWQQTFTFQQACQMAVSGLQDLMRVYQTPNRTIYFHCTAGEDRTGLLAALFHRLIDPSLTPQDAFTGDMCRYGYSSGDPKKPDLVDKVIDFRLTPVYLKMSSLIDSGRLSATSLDPSLCPQDIPLPAYADQDWVCKPVSLP